jgi:hypothetical protein
VKNQKSIRMAPAVATATTGTIPKQYVAGHCCNYSSCEKIDIFQRVLSHDILSCVAVVAVRGK